MRPLPFAAILVPAAGSEEASQALGTTRCRCFSLPMGVRAGLCARSRLLLAGNGRKNNAASARQLPGLLLITRQRCKELHKDESGNSVADFNELTRELIATSQ